MQLKHKGTTVVIALTKTETRLLEKASKLLECIVLLPSKHQDKAGEAMERIEDIIDAIGKRDNVEIVETA